MSDDGGVQGELGSTAPPPPPPPVPAGNRPTTTNGFAVAALVLGIVAAIFFWTVVLGIALGILAIIFGAIAMSRTNTGAPNKGLATAGIVLGIVSVVGSIAFVVLLASAAHNADEQVSRVTFCINHPDDPSC
jgi:Domain of unknown function (DUF4190)